MNTLPSKVLVPGVARLLGSSRLLSKGHHLTGIDNLSKGRLKGCTRHSGRTLN